MTFTISRRRQGARSSPVVGQSPSHSPACYRNPGGTVLTYAPTSPFRKLIKKERDIAVALSLRNPGKAVEKLNPALLVHLSVNSEFHVLLVLRAGLLAANARIAGIFESREPAVDE